MSKSGKKIKKYKRRLNPRLIKRNSTYSIQEIASLYEIHPNRINGWLKVGLKKIDSKKPYLIFGQDLADFIRERNSKAKKSCAPDEMFCCKCKAPRKVTDNTARIKVINPKKLMIAGVCVKCGTKMNRLGTASKMGSYRKIFKFLTVQDEQLLGCVNTSTNTD